MSDLVRYSPPSGEEWGQLVQTADMVAKAPFVPDAIRGNAGAVMGAMLMGRELGIGPMQSLNDISFIKGRRTLAATLMVSLVRARGHKFRTIESTAKHAVVQIHRKGEAEPEPAVEFTWADAERAKLTGGDNYTKYPTAMLWSRATSAACRRDASECLGGSAYTPEEIDSIDEPGATTATWGEPMQESGPAEGKGKALAGPDHMSGRSGERGTPVRGPMQSGDPAMTPTDRTTSPASSASGQGADGEAPGQAGANPAPGPATSATGQGTWFDEVVNHLFVTVQMATDLLAAQPTFRTFFGGATGAADRAARLRELTPTSDLARRARRALDEQFGKRDDGKAGAA